MVDAPIGIFDSGVGGLTVARPILDQLPHEPILYLGDTAQQPVRPQAASPRCARIALEVMDDLVDAGVKLLVIACNTASVGACCATPASGTAATRFPSSR